MMKTYELMETFLDVIFETYFCDTPKYSKENYEAALKDIYTFYGILAGLCSRHKVTL